MNLDYLPEYQTVYVVSDLHLGGFSEGERDYRIFNESEALAAFIQSVTRQPDVCLVLNGDIVDYLAHEEPKYFDWTHAVRKLNHALEDEQQKQVWQALQAFVKADQGDLVLVLGNHDLELALPDPQQRLLHYLSDGVRKLRGRVVLATDGAGFACRVGRKRVLCLHGNEADPWNAIEYGDLSLIRRSLARNSENRNWSILSNWVPNPGTQLVIEYMNQIKRQFQWVDLLKPEEETTAMVSAAVSQLPGIRTFVEVLSRKQENERRLQQGFMGGTAADAELPRLAAVPRLGPVPPAEVDQSILDAIGVLGRNVPPEQLIPGDAADYLMETRELAWRTAKLKGRALFKHFQWPSGLRETLLATFQKNAFAINTPDDTFTELDNLCGPDIDYLIAGHTHLQRALERKRFKGKYYFNSGSWIRLLRIPEELLAADRFAEVEARLRDGRLSELEKDIEVAGGKHTLLATTRTVVRISKPADGEVRGELLTVELVDGKWQLEEVKGSVLPVLPAAAAASGVSS